LASVYGLTAPPRAVGSLARITHSTPDTTPELEEGCVAIQQQLDALARQQLASGAVPLHVSGAAAAARLTEQALEIREALEHRRTIRAVDL
jgi:hypothetical protein